MEGNVALPTDSIWRSTLSDGNQPFVNYHAQVKELTDKDLKTYTTDFFDTVAKDNIIPKVEKYQANQFYYHKKHGYLQIKKYIESKQAYVCKVKQDEKDPLNAKEQQEVEVPHEELGSYIIVSAKILSENEPTMARFQVNINDPITSLKDFAGGKLSVIYNGELIADKSTYQKRFIKEGAQFMLLSGSKEIKRWNRFSTISQTDYFYMYGSWADAIKFVPKVDVTFMGFGFFKQYETKDFKLVFQVYVDGQASEEQTIEVKTDMLEDKFFNVNFEKLGFPTYEVKAGTGIDILGKCFCDHSCIFHYGQGRNPEDNAEDDFEIDRSDYNQNSTHQEFGQFPYILYSK